MGEEGLRSRGARGQLQQKARVPQSCKHTELLTGRHRAPEEVREPDTVKDQEPFPHAQPLPGGHTKLTSLPPQQFIVCKPVLSARTCLEAMPAREVRPLRAESMGLRFRGTSRTGEAMVRASGLVGAGGGDVVTAGGLRACPW